MRIQDIQGVHKIRDFRICKLWLEDDKTQQEIADLVGLSERHIGRIVYKNRRVLELEENWEKAKRKHWLKIQIKKRGDSKKDSADLIEQLRKETEGDKPTIDQSQHYHFTNIKQIIENATNHRNNRIRESSPSPEALER